MTESQRLERGYRRIVALYPRSFRRDSEEEIVGVLMATAREGQRRVGPAESADLIRGAVRMHRGPRLPRGLLTAVRLTYVGAAAELGVLIVLLVTAASLASASIRRYPDFSAAQWQAVLLGHLAVVAAGGPVLLALWAWMACANARGESRGQGRLLGGLGHHQGRYRGRGPRKLRRLRHRRRARCRRPAIRPRWGHGRHLLPQQGRAALPPAPPARPSPALKARAAR